MCTQCASHELFSRAQHTVCFSLTQCASHELFSRAQHTVCFSLTQFASLSHNSSTQCASLSHNVHTMCFSLVPFIDSVRLSLSLSLLLLSGAHERNKRELSLCERGKRSGSNVPLDSAQCARFLASLLHKRHIWREGGIVYVCESERGADAMCFSLALSCPS